MMNLRFYSFAAAVLSAALALTGFPARCLSGEYAIGLRDQPVTLSAEGNAAAWDGSLGVDGFVDRTGKLVSRTGRFWIARTKETLFFRIESELPPEGKLLARVSPEKGNSNAVALDDTVEIWLAPLPAGGEKSTAAYQLMINPLGAVYSAVHDPSAAATLGNWKPGAVVRSGFPEGQWNVEAAIPLASITPDPATLQGVRFRVVRNWRRPAQASASESFAAGGGFANVETMSRLLFRRKAPAVDFRRLLEPSRGGLDLQIAMSAAKGVARDSLDVQVNIESTSNVSPRVQSRQFDLVENRPGLFEMRGRLDPATDFNATVAIFGREGMAFERRFAFSTAEPKDGWSVRREEAPRRFQIAYSPYRQLLLVEDGERSRPSAEIGVAITGKNGAALSVRLRPEQWMKTQAGERAIAAVPVPKLETGEYTVSLSRPEDGAPEVHPLKVERFGWEHNGIGEDDSVPPPFLPVRAEGNTAALLLREYEFDEAALPAAIRAEGVPVLAAGATIEGRINGRREALVGRSLELSRKDSSAVFTSSWDLGPVHGRTTATVAFDGLVRTEFVFPATPGAVVEELTLRIPVRGGEARLMHSVGAGIRGNYAGAIPGGQGVVWSNLDAMAYGYPENFIPYLWVGGVRRGLALMADSSSGWSIGSQKPAVRLVREGDALVLEAAIVSSPLAFDKERVVTFCWQATPLKNKPTDWRSYSFGGGDLPSSRAIRIHGSGLYWGAISSFGDVYPRGRDYSFLKEMAQAKKTRKLTPELNAFINEWNRGYAALPREEKYHQHVKSGFAAAIDADCLVPYTNARGVRETLPEFRAYQDEWVRQGFTSRKWSEDDFGEIKTDPAPSFQDFALWNFRQMREAGYAAGIYFDNDYLVATENPFSLYDHLAAYGDGARPSTGLLLLRDYFLRVYRLFSEGGTLPLNIMHMTNAAIAPHLAFATVQLDWEMKYGSEDFQDRFKEDSIFASTIGEQFGTIPLVLSGIYPSREKSAEWLTRTLFGTASVYEIKVWPTFKIDAKNWGRWQKVLFEFGYGEQDCEVYRFWEEPPFSLNRPDVRAIVMRRGARILCIVTDFGNGGDTGLALEPTLTGGKALRCRDLETGEMLPCQEGKVRFALKKHDFKIVLLEEE